MRLLRLLILFGIFGAFAAACGDDDYNADAAATTADFSSFLSDGGTNG